MLRLLGLAGGHVLIRQWVRRWVRSSSSVLLLREEHRIGVIPTHAVHYTGKGLSCSCHLGQRNRRNSVGDRCVSGLEGLQRLSLGELCVESLLNSGIQDAGTSGLCRGRRERLDLLDIIG